jgi:long-chain acyl-CoA synthetase
VTEVQPPAVRFGGRTWTRDELGALATRWHEDLVRQLGPSPPLLAGVMANHPESIAMFFALTCFPAPVILLGDDPRSWRSSPPLPRDTPVVLSEPSHHLAGSVASTGCRPLTVSVARRAPRRPPPAAAFLAGPGFVGFTGGTTGLPKPVYRSMASALRHAAVVAEILALRPGAGIVGALPLSTFHGLGDTLLLATLLDSVLGLLPRFDHRSTLRLFATEPYGYFAATPMMVDVLARCPVTGSAPRAPALVKVAGGRLPAAAFDAFLDRFGTPPRPAYGASETGIITADVGPADRVRPTAVGCAVPDVRIAIGDLPEAPAPAGVPGRVWVSTPRYMEGYGFPPDLEPREGWREWRPMRDRGVVDNAGYLTLLGRLDDAFKTPGGQLVDPTEVAEIILRLPEVGDVVVLPLLERTGCAVGAVVAGGPGLGPAQVRRHAARFLPRWAQPRVVVVVERLPQRANGKVDRDACTALLETATTPAAPLPGFRSAD